NRTLFRSPTTTRITPIRKNGAVVLLSIKSYIRSTNGLTISRRPTNNASFVQNSIRGPTHKWVINSNRHYLLVIYNSNYNTTGGPWQNLPARHGFLAISGSTRPKARSPTRRAV